MLLAEELQRVVCGSEVLDFGQLEKGRSMKELIV